jgi:hypothetical protein
MGLAAARNRWCCSRNVRARFVVNRCSPFRLEAHRSSAPPKQLSLSLRLPVYHRFLTSEEGDIRSPKSLRFAPMWGCPQTELG